MIVKSRGIILNQIKFGDTSLIIRIYTEREGVLSFIVKGVRRTKSKFHASLFEKLTLVEVLFDYNPAKSIHQLKDIANIYAFNSIPFNVHKSSIAIFLTEVLSKSLKVNESNEEKFKFVFNAIVEFDLLVDALSVFHIFFLLKLTSFLGFFPLNNFSSSNSIFNLQEGRFVSSPYLSFHCIDHTKSRLFSEVIDADLTLLNKLLINKENRTFILEMMLTYYRLHVPDFKETHSLLVLQSVFSD